MREKLQPVFNGFWDDDDDELDGANKKTIMEELAEFLDALKAVSNGTLAPTELDEDYEEEDDKQELPANKYKLLVLDHFINIDKVTTLEKFGTAFQQRQKGMEAFINACGTTIHTSFNVDNRVLLRDDLFCSDDDDSDEEDPRDKENDDCYDTSDDEFDG